MGATPSGHYKERRGRYHAIMGVPGRVRLLLIQPHTETTLPTIQTTMSPNSAHCNIGLSNHSRIFRPKRRASTPSAVKRTILAAPTTANILRREYCSAAAAITNGVNGKGGGAREASASAHAAFFATLDFTCARRRF